MKPRICDCREDPEYMDMLKKLGYKDTDEVPDISDIVLRIFKLVERKNLFGKLF